MQPEIRGENEVTKVIMKRSLKLNFFDVSTALSFITSKSRMGGKITRVKMTGGAATCFLREHSNHCVGGLRKTTAGGGFELTISTDQNFLTTSLTFD